MRFCATSEHTAGQSTSHCCRQGVWSDPTDDWEETIEATSIADAERQAMAALVALALEQPECDCGRRRTAGSERWQESVVVTLWPQDDAAAIAVEAEERDVWSDPYGLVPQSVRAGHAERMSAVTDYTR